MVVVGGPGKKMLRVEAVVDLRRKIDARLMDMEVAEGVRAGEGRGTQLSTAPSTENHFIILGLFKEEQGVGMGVVEKVKIHVCKCNYVEEHRNEKEKEDESSKLGLPAIKRK